MSLKTSLPLPMKLKCPHLLRVHCCVPSPNVKMEGWTNRSWSEVMVVSLLSPQYHHLPRVQFLPLFGLKPDLLPSQCWALLYVAWLPLLQLAETVPLFCKMCKYPLS